jgi:O-acetyl-ADP-ribose deacetylase
VTDSSNQPQELLHARRPFRRCPEPECSYFEQATRVVHTSRSSWLSAKTYLHTEFRWLANRCPNDGNPLVGACDECHTLLTDYQDVCCRHCGKRYWWTVVVGEGDVDIEIWGLPENKIETIGRIGVYGINQSIANLVADAVVSSDDASGAMRGRSAARLKQVGGSEIESESMSIHQNLGEAWLTNPGTLHVQHVIHVGLLDPDDSTSADLIASAMDNSLRLADEHRLKSVAYPALGTGRSGFPMPESARIVREAIIKYVDEFPLGSLENVVFVLFAPVELTEFRLGFAPPTAAIDASTPPPRRRLFNRRNPVK